MTSVAAARRFFESSTTAKDNRISIRRRIDHSWMPTSDASSLPIDENIQTGSGSINMAATANDGPFRTSYSSPTAVTRNHRRSEPRELNDDELMAADEDGDQLLVFGVPTVSHGSGQNGGHLNRNDDAVRELMQQNGKQQTIKADKLEKEDGSNGGGNSRHSRATSGEQPWSNVAEQTSSDFGRVTLWAEMSDKASNKRNGEIDTNQPRDQFSVFPSIYAAENDFEKSSLHRPLTVTTTTTPTDDRRTPISPASSGGLLSPSGSASGRRSALPVPTIRYGGTRAKLPSIDGESGTTPSHNGVAQRSPMTSPPTSMTSSPSWPVNGSAYGSGTSRPSSATHHQLNGDPLSPRANTNNNNTRSAVNGTSGSFVRRDVTRASMFERGSRKHNPASSTRGLPVHSSQNGATDRGGETHRNRPRSTSPSARNGLVVQPPAATSAQSPRNANDTAATDRLMPYASDACDVISGSEGRRSRPLPINTNTSSADGWNANHGRSSVFNKMLPNVNASPISLAGDHSAPRSNEGADDTHSVRADTSLFDFRLTVTDVTDIVANLSSSEWNDRRDGLISLQNMFRTNAGISPSDLKRITDIFTRMFHDPQKKIFVILVEVLADFFYVHADDLGYWVPIVLPRLFAKIGGNDLRGSVHSKIQRALDAARETFPCDVQLETLANFMTDQVQLQGVKAKEAILDYLHELVLDMDTTDLVNTPTLRALLLRIVLWAAECSEIRKEAEAVIAAMFNVNAPEFALVMTSQPKGVQEFVDRILKNHMRTAHGIADPPTQRKIRYHDNGEDQRAPVVQPVEHNGNQQASSSQLQPQHRRVKSMPSSEQHNGGTTTPKTTSRHKSIPAPTPSSAEKGRPVVTGLQPSRMTPVKGLTPPSRIQLPRSTTPRKPVLSVDSGVATVDEAGGQAGGESGPESKLSPRLGGIPEPHRQRNQPQEQRVATSTPSPSVGNNGNTGSRTIIEMKSSPTTLEDHIREIPAEISINDNANDCSRWWTYIVGTLSNAAASRDDRRTAIRQLIDSLPNNPATISTSGVRSIVAVLLSSSTAGDEVSALANECASMLLDSALHPVARCRLLNELIQLGVQPINVAALQLLRATLNDVTDSDVTGQLPELVNCLLKVYEDDDRNVRKAGVDVLVQLYTRVGDQIWLHVRSLSDAKIKGSEKWIEPSPISTVAAVPSCYCPPKKTRIQRTTANFLKTRFRRAVVSKSTGGEEML